jgi:hypothetical protein
MLTPEEQCTADGGTYVDGTCKSAEQVAAEGAIIAANMAALTLDNTSDAAAVQAVADLIAAAETAIAALPAADQAAETAKLAASQAVVDAQNARLKAEAAEKAALDAEEARKAEEAAKAAEEARKAAEEARMAAMEAARKMAAKLYGAIGTMRTVETNVVIGDDLMLGDSTTDPSQQRTLKESAVASALGDWAGQQYASTDGKHNATAYSIMSDPEMGDAFSDATIAGRGALDTNSGEYALDVASLNAAHVDIDSFSRTSGTEEYEVDGDTENRIKEAGSLNGVRGYFYCAPGGDACAASVANSDGTGITLGGDGTWTFKPNNAADQVTATPGTVTHAFGWWLDESGDDPVVRVFTSAPAVATDSPYTTTRGTATFTGAAAGKYALNRGAGGENDSGHFTANAELTATFAAGGHSIKGTIDGFVGADGEPRDDWSVALGSLVMDSNGQATATTDDAATPDVDESLTTVWTIGDAAANPAGSWITTATGNEGGTPTAATGTFNAGYDNVGRMIGAFGVEAE